MQFKPTLKQNSQVQRLTLHHLNQKKSFKSLIFLKLTALRLAPLI